eukprot:scaffold67986_cov37-Tisochrysis_lutea.AAC.2
MASAARCPRSLEEYRSAPASARSATRAFLLSSAYVSFWGSNNHLRLLIERVHAVTHSVAFSSLIGRNRSLPFERGSFSLIDVGAGQYNSVGGDISHALLYARLWSCDELGAILGFEPTEEAFRRLVRLREEEERERGARPCMQLVQKAVGRSVGAGDMAPQAGAGHNTASLDRKFAPRGVARTRVEVTTIDEQLSGPLARQDVLVLKVDVEGYEMSVLRGATNALHSGRIHLILLEYGDKVRRASVALSARLVAARRSGGTAKARPHSPAPTGPPSPPHRCVGKPRDLGLYARGVPSASRGRISEGPAGCLPRAGLARLAPGMG